MEKSRGLFRHCIFLISLCISLVSLLCGCDSIGGDFDFNGDLRNKVDNDISVTFRFYEYPELTSPHKDITVYTGKTLKKEEFPLFEHENQYFMGFKYYNTSGKSDKIPSNIKTDENSIVQSISATTASESFYAEWKNKCLVSFHTNSDFELEPIYLPEGDLVPAPEFDHKRGNFRFKNWYTDEALTQLYDFSEPLAGDLTLYAKWIEVRTIVYHKNDGSDEKKEYDYALGNSSTIQECIFGERSGYGFVGWSTSASGSADNSYWPDSNHTLTDNLDLWAVWSPTLYTFTYVDMSGVFPNRKAVYGAGAHVTVGRTLNDNGNMYKNIPDLWKRPGIAIKGFDTSGTKFNTDPMTYDPWGEYDDSGTIKNYITASSDMTFYVYWDESVKTDITVTVSFNVINDPDAIMRPGYPAWYGSTTILDLYAYDFNSYTWYLDNKIYSLGTNRPLINLETADLSTGQHELELIVTKVIDGTTYYYSYFCQFEVTK